jgi:hypothetical protein
VPKPLVEKALKESTKPADSWHETGEQRAISMVFRFLHGTVLDARKEWEEEQADIAARIEPKRTAYEKLARKHDATAVKNADGTFAVVFGRAISSIEVKALHEDMKALEAEFTAAPGQG